MQTVRNFEFSALDRMCLSHPITQGPGICGEEEVERLLDPEVSDNSNYSETRRVWTYKLSRTVRKCTGPAQAQFRQEEGAQIQSFMPRKVSCSHT